MPFFSSLVETLAGGICSVEVDSNLADWEEDGAGRPLGYEDSSTDENEAAVVDMIALCMTVDIIVAGSAFC